MTELEAALKAHLASGAALLYPGHESPEEAAAARRVNDLVAAAPPVLCLLAEPWLGQIARQKRHWQILLHCASLHLYSRVLDDAVDEAHACYKKALLRVQPLFFDAVFRLGILAPGLLEEGRQLIGETTEAVLADDATPSALYWGAKNHHLLLIPLFLSGDAAFFRRARAALSASLALLQATDELEQGSCLEAGVYCRLVTEAMKESVHSVLAAGGWPSLGQRLCMESRRLLRMLQNPSPDHQEPS